MATDLSARATAESEAKTSRAREPREEASIVAVPPTALEHNREHSRFSVDLDVTIGSDHNFYAGLAENLSAGGVFIATHELKPVGSKIELSVHLPGGARVQASGEVRWLRVFNEHSDSPPGMGVKFCTLDANSTAAIEAFLSERDPLFFDDD